jgi:tetratricopeptide (TPR) repeat protein
MLKALAPTKSSQAAIKLAVDPCLKVRPSVLIKNRRVLFRRGNFLPRVLVSLFVYWWLTLATPVIAAAQQNASNYDRLERAARMIGEGQLATAEAELNAVLQRAPQDANGLNLLGVVRAQQQRAAEAEGLFLRALKAKPTLLGAYLNLGRLYLELQKEERALWSFAEAVKLAPDDADINLNLALLYERKREYERALLHLRKIPPSQMGADHLYVLIKSHLGLGQVREAQALSQSLKQPGKVPAEMAAAFAAAFAERELFDDAIQILEAARQGSGEASFALLYNLGTAYYRKGEFARAEQYYTEALASKPNDVEALRALARVARAAGELEKALAYLIRARSLAPKSEPVLYDFGWTALNLNLLFDALPVLEALQRAHPDEPGYLYALGIARLQNGEAQRAVELLNRFVKLRPAESGGYYVLGAALYGLKQFPQARAMLERSVAIAPYPDAEYYLGMIAYNEGDAERAAIWLQRALKSEPKYAAARTALGMVYARQKNYQAARVELERAMELNPKDATASYQLGLVYARLGEKTLAQNMFTTADKLRAENEKERAVRFRLVDPPK